MRPKAIKLSTRVVITTLVFILVLSSDLEGGWKGRLVFWSVMGPMERAQQS